MTIETRLNPGHRCVFLRADCGAAVQLLAFAESKARTLEIWHTPDERKIPPQRTGTVREYLEPLRVAHLLASGEAGSHLDAGAVDVAVVEGVPETWEPVLLGAWAHVLARQEPHLHALLAVEPDLVRLCLQRSGVDASRVADLRELATQVVEADRAWVETWRGAIEEEVRDRIALREGLGVEGEPSPAEGAIRAFVEACVSKLGRLPREDEDARRWDGKELVVAGLTRRQREKLGLDVTGQIGSYRVRISYLSAIEAHGWDFDRGAGWYLAVMNPHPSWRFSDPVGPHLSPEDALADSAGLAGQE